MGEADAVPDRANQISSLYTPETSIDNTSGGRYDWYKFLHASFRRSLSHGCVGGWKRGVSEVKRGIGFTRTEPNISVNVVPSLSRCGLLMIDERIAGRVCTWKTRP